MADTAYKEHWETGERAYYEYHCLESAESQDAHLWARSHQVVTVLSRNVEDEVANGAEGMTFSERAEEGVPATYEVQFADGLVGTAWEDELMIDPQFFYRPDPPKSLL